MADLDGLIEFWQLYLRFHDTQLSIYQTSILKETITALKELKRLRKGVKQTL